MYDFKAMEIFANIVEHGSMNKAANVLNITPSAVSQHIQKLEQQYKITLLNRTTRKLQLTEAGMQFYDGCRKMLSGAEAAANGLESIRDNAIGSLRVSLVTGMMGDDINKICTKLLTEHPNLKLTLFFNDNLIDLIENRIDVAIRVGGGALDSATLVARHLTTSELILCASSEYLVNSPNKINEPKDLLQGHNIIMPSLKQKLAFEHTITKDSIDVTLMPNIVCDNMWAIRKLVTANLGIGLQLKREIKSLLDNGIVQEILPEWTPPLSMDIYAVTLQRTQSYKVKYFLDLLKQELAG